MTLIVRQLVVRAKFLYIIPTNRPCLCQSNFKECVPTHRPSAAITGAIRGLLEKIEENVGDGVTVFTGTLLASRARYSCTSRLESSRPLSGRTSTCSMQHGSDFWCPRNIIVHPNILGDIWVIFVCLGSTFTARTHDVSNPPRHVHLHVRLYRPY